MIIKNDKILVFLRGIIIYNLIPIVMDYLKSNMFNIFKNLYFVLSPIMNIEFLDEIFIYSCK